MPIIINDPTIEARKKVVVGGGQDAIVVAWDYCALNNLIPTDFPVDPMISAIIREVRLKYKSGVIDAFEQLNTLTAFYYCCQYPLWDKSA